MAGRRNQEAPETEVSSGGTAYGPLWESIVAELAQAAPSPGAATLCLHLRPLRETWLLQQWQAETREMQAWLQESDPFQGKNLPQEKHWLKKRLQQPGSKPRELADFLQLLEELRQTLQRNQNRWPALWKLGRELQSDATLLQHIQPRQVLSRETLGRLRQRQAWLEQQERLLDQIGLVVARARYAQRHGGALARVSADLKLELKAWRPARLSYLTPLHLHFNPELRVLILSGAHGSGKTRLLQSFYLDLLAHHCGLPAHWAPESVLPVFSGLQFLPAEQTVAERLQALKPLLQQDAQRLVLIDGFLTQTAAGENYALGRAVLEKLGQQHGLTLISSHDHLLSRQVANGKNLRVLGLKRSGQRKQAQVELCWDQPQSSDLKTQARLAGWPSSLLELADRHWQTLTAKAPGDKQKTQVPKAQTKPKSKPAAAPTAKRPCQPLPQGLAPGTPLYIPSLNQYGELRSGPNRRQEVEISCGDKIIRLSAQQVVLSSHRKEKKGDPSGMDLQTWSERSDWSVKTWSEGREACDLHGLTVDEALPLLEKFLDTAYHQGLAQVRIIHGKGTSALRRAVQARLAEMLAENTYISHYRLGHPGEGDSGVTIVNLK